MHPLDTLICRIQSGAVHHQSRTGCRLFDGSLYHRLYQGFGPTVIASIPASIVFLSVYETVRLRCSEARAAGQFAGSPQYLDDAAGSVAGEIFACAILNPAQVLKQNAQVYKAAPGKTTNQLSKTTTARLLKSFVKQPSKLWTGYTVYTGAQLPHVCLMFSFYEYLKRDSSFRACKVQEHDTKVQQVLKSAICGGIAGCCASWIFVPADVLKLRLRLAAGRGLEHQRSYTVLADAAPVLSNTGRSCVLATARSIVRDEGWTALFRGSILTCIAAGIGGSVYLGTYEAIKSLGYG